MHAKIELWILTELGMWVVVVIEEVVEKESRRSSNLRGLALPRHQDGEQLKVKKKKQRHC